MSSKNRISIEFVNRCDVMMKKKWKICQKRSLQKIKQNINTFHVRMQGNRNIVISFARRRKKRIFMKRIQNVK